MYSPIRPQEHKYPRLGNIETEVRNRSYVSFRTEARALVRLCEVANRDSQIIRQVFADVCRGIPPESVPRLFLLREFGIIHSVFPLDRQIGPEEDVNLRKDEHENGTE